MKACFFARDYDLNSGLPGQYVGLDESGGEASLLSAP